MRIVLAVLACVTMFLDVDASAAEITVQGTWTLTVTADDFTGGPGSELRSTYESQPGQVLLGVGKTAGISSRWRMDVRRAAGAWPSQLRLFVRVTDIGVGPGLIASDGGFVEIDSVDRPVLSGTGDRSSIAVLFRLTGMSLIVAPRDYSTNLVFTLVEII